jgi:ATP-dependent DNA helicase DinG
MSTAPPSTQSNLRVAILHLVATGPQGAAQFQHGLVHIGWLPLEAGAQAEDRIINPGRVFSGQFGDAIGIKNPTAQAALPWSEQASLIQESLATFDALLVLDRAGKPSPEREWLEKVVLHGMERRPAVIALDVLLAFFLPGYTLDDADDLKEVFLLPNTALQAACGYSPGKPQLPFILHTMRYALRKVLAAVLTPEQWGKVDGELVYWLPIYGLLQRCLSLSGARILLRPFRLLAQLAQNPTCCDPAQDTTIGAATTAVLPNPAAYSEPDDLKPQVIKRMLAAWLQQFRAVWGAAPVSAAAEKPKEGRVEEAAVTTAFAELAAGVRDSALKSGDKTASWQPRQAQQDYARFVTKAINENGIYALEAGTGTGKTFGYLVPALEYLRCHPDGLVVVATSTKNLQEQMLAGELPALLRPKGKPNARYQSVRIAMLKGKNSYLCADALADAFGECLDEKATWQDGLSWLYLALRLRDTKGEIENVAQAVEVALTPPGSWRSVLSGWRVKLAADRACRHADNGPRHAFAICVYEAHRMWAEQAHLLVLNHHKLAMLPRRLLERQGRICIIDEADRFPDNYRNAIASELNARELAQEALLKLLGRSYKKLPTRYPAPTEAGGPEHAEETGLLGRAQQRLQQAYERLWYESGFGPLGSPDNADDVTALEAWDEARLQDLLGKFALHQQVADAMADTPAAVDAQATADAAFAAYEAVRSIQVTRRAAGRALGSLRQLRQPAQHCQELLPTIGQHFMPEGSRQLARLPFPVGRESHWLDPVRVEQPSGPAHYRNFYWQLHKTLQPLEGPLSTTSNLLNTVRDLVPVALQLAAPAESNDEDGGGQTAVMRLRRQLEQVAEQIGQSANTLAQLLASGRKAAHVPVLERMEGEEHSPLGWRLSRAPYDLKPYLQGPVPGRPAGGGLAESAFFDQFSVTIFTSATIYVQKSTGYFRQQLNLSEPFKAELCLPPTFDYFDTKAEYVAGLLPHYLPTFDSSASLAAKERWRSEQLRALLPLIVAFGGRTLVLFTSREEMLYTAEKLRPHLLEQDIELLVQQGTSQWQIRRFRRVEQSVLLGVERMWTGVDFAGPTLAQVVVWRLPMPSFSDPLVCHRKLHETKTDFWDNFYYPTTRLKLRQGFGRLVRRSSDRGAFVVLDSRANQEFYHHLLSEILISPFVGLTAAEAMHQHVVDNTLILIDGLKEDFRTYRKLTAKKLAEMVPESF